MSYTFPAAFVHDIGTDELLSITDIGDHSQHLLDARGTVWRWACEGYRVNVSTALRRSSFDIVEVTS